jgi:hypothetical protein
VSAEHITFIFGVVEWSERETNKSARKVSPKRWVLSEIHGMLHGQHFEDVEPDLLPASKSTKKVLLM